MNFILGEPIPLSPEEEERRERARQELLRNADPVLLRRIERWEHHAMVPLEPSLPIALRSQPTHFDRLADWYAGYLGVRAEYEPSYELRRDLKERVPQALLRDIYRPVRGHDSIDFVCHEALDHGGRAAMAEAKQALNREPIPTIEPVLLTVLEYQKWRQRLMRTPWQPFLRDDAPRRPANGPF